MTAMIEVQQIVSDAISAAGFKPNLVSNSEAVGVILKRIVQNLYDDPVVVCDISGKNPNVMFELGLRLAFDKPTIIIKDDHTSYSFDTAPIEHLEYPRDLRFSKIVEFKSLLGDKIKATHKAASDPSYTTFLKHFGEFTVAKLDKKEVSGHEFLAEQFALMHEALARLERAPRSPRPVKWKQREMDVCMGPTTLAGVEKAIAFARKYPGVRDVELRSVGDGHHHVLAHFETDAMIDREAFTNAIRIASGEMKDRSAALKLVELPPAAKS